MTEPRTDWNRIGRYLAGESTPDEAAQVRQWLAEHPSEARAIVALDTVSRVGSRTVDVEAALRRVKARSVRRRPWGLAVVVAAALILITIGVLARVLPTHPAARAYATSSGQRQNVALSARANAILAPNSRIVATPDDVTLTGTAFFSVRHDAARPFTVHVGDVVVRDVGTRFAVQQDHAAVRVVVTEGTVRVDAAGSSMTVNAGDVADVTGSHVELRRGTATDDDVAWTTGRLVFRDTPLARVASDLGRWYGVQVQVRDPALLSRHFTGTFDNQPIERVLDVLRLALGARLDRSADTVYLGNFPPTR